MGERHGRIAGGTISVTDLDRSIAAYQTSLSQTVIEKGEVPDAQARQWGLGSVAGARYAVLQTPVNPLSSLRLIEVDALPHTPAVSCGWNAFEITVKDVFGLATHLQDSEFTVVGPPKRVDGFTSFIPMQAFGPDGEVLFLNQVFHSDDDTDLPLAGSDVAEIFIVVLASSDREASAQQYAKALGMKLGGTHRLRYGLINRAFGFDADALQTITMVQNARTPFLQADQYPSQATSRAAHINGLPMGNSMVSVWVNDIERARRGFTAVGAVGPMDGEWYKGRKIALVRGLAGELVELIEL